MDIHGDDINIPNLDTPWEMMPDVPKSAADKMWPHWRMVFYSDLPIPGLYEWFIYRNEEARASWDRLGWDETNKSDMIHVLHGGEEVTVVVEDRDEPLTKAFLDEIRTFLAEAHNVD